MKQYLPTIGLEIHAELKTLSKMFCGCANNPDEQKPNRNVCPVCMGHPGTLPVINERAVEHVLRVGVALQGKLADFSEFDRKNYFYPDIPKGYQISQYKYPLVSGGELNGVLITRVHLEEDTGTSLHEEGDYSLVDYNRAGVPLMELVTEPVIHDGKSAAAFAKELQLLLRTLCVSSANMEKGEMRVEANISISKTDTFGTKVEVKNLNSFRAVERAIQYEIERQEAVLEAGEKVVQETRGFDEGKQKTFSQRKKEESHDYRYFPEPDLPKLRLSKLGWANEDNLRKGLPELPSVKRARYAKDYGIKPEDIENYVYGMDIGQFFEKTANIFENDKKLIALASNYISSDLIGIQKSGKSLEKLLPESFAELIRMIGEGQLSSRGAKDTLAKMVETGGNPRLIAKDLGVIQIHDPKAIQLAAEKVIANNPKVVEDYKGGKSAALQFLIGQVMRETKGSAKPDTVRKLLEEALSNLSK
ncbi:MAG: glutaminyl-tRNA synthase (glutamine-hydrolyzing) subunit B [Candidatus Taylorbacteria bacterium RIFCSPLOWO2_02_FULL_43_11]|uniref:Aspartyl/glutamyl-tRNA(Asn/Gln) amidotransferase subunit B n=1 Tax=Candidatus Taylorbacteria bacterium RIFCSPHIGHO2_02_FULL_43_32b TaxID=1802306 RepID=A0A1G2MMP4_9BACT|nr:MAG: glutaminyl-tRNA synthase (glutamine-hydrolyzing) subunit B [Candidatus Taylorbacteria bacterium RIFCSPHIGHO2_01_FULL_43_47]OHA24272.1 MAG: glutaminyl-tRNA synthase (glutamine-hydrolyzing) subunit B [Candidatus Taylorbacteria bacterium RIFCSPHIGHO2_02_FULL_43_32b]OHA31389.1 MAG: glutaminyl-tRNA synthase (glutamine-hydrolyzing) subunit B [Candidatus Taylorbacteria bacterium RIFCSPLOWO2_01_FULL_43_44]OHA36584.1 MAG: glutaminyl-tRNA synthase (glutamine-hydrolyzing) subunit B [Candidatus Tayl